MKKTFKRFLAFAMVAVMMANPMSALAADTTTEETTSPAIGSADASGDVEGFVDTTIFKVVLPTSADDTFDFIMDPQGLIAATSGEAYAGATFGNGTVFFNTASANASGDYKNTSNYIEVLNRGTVAVNVSVEATVTGLDKIAMASSDAAFTSGDAAVPELYLAFIASGDCTSGDAAANTTPILTTDSKTSATITTTMPAASSDFYQFNYASGEYSFDLKADKASGDATIFPDYSFALTGACNSEADWTDAKNEVPDVNVVWTLEDAETDSAIATDVAWSSTGQYFYLSVPDVETLDMSKLSNVRVVQDSVDEAVSSYNKSDSGKYFTITWSAIKTNLLWPASNPGKTITFNFTYDGVQYTATYSAE